MEVPIVMRKMHSPKSNDARRAKKLLKLISRVESARLELRRAVQALRAVLQAQH